MVKTKKKKKWEGLCIFHLCRQRQGNGAESYPLGSFTFHSPTYLSWSLITTNYQKQILLNNNNKTKFLSMSICNSSPVKQTLSKVSARIPILTEIMH